MSQNFSFFCQALCVTFIRLCILSQISYLKARLNAFQDLRGQIEVPHSGFETNLISLFGIWPQAKFFHGASIFQFFSRKNIMNTVLCIKWAHLQLHVTFLLVDYGQFICGAFVSPPAIQLCLSRDFQGYRSVTCYSSVEKLNLEFHSYSKCKGFFFHN